LLWSDMGAVLLQDSLVQYDQIGSHGRGSRP
jgi:hypothetical protein